MIETGSDAVQLFEINLQKYCVLCVCVFNEVHPLEHLKNLVLWYD
jgi:hypothetical protein